MTLTCHAALSIFRPIAVVFYLWGGVGRGGEGWGGAGCLNILLGSLTAGIYAGDQLGWQKQRRLGDRRGEGGWRGGGTWEEGGHRAEGLQQEKRLRGELGRGSWGGGCEQGGGGAGGTAGGEGGLQAGRGRGRDRRRAPGRRAGGRLQERPHRGPQSRGAPPPPSPRAPHLAKRAPSASPARRAWRSGKHPGSTVAGARLRSPAANSSNPADRAARSGGRAPTVQPACSHRGRAARLGGNGSEGAECERRTAPCIPLPSSFPPPPLPAPGQSRGARPALHGGVSPWGVCNAGSSPQDPACARCADTMQAKHPHKQSLPENYTYAAPDKPCALVWTRACRSTSGEVTGQLPGAESALPAPLPGPGDPAPVVRLHSSSGLHLPGCLARP